MSRNSLGQWPPSRAPHAQDILSGFSVATSHARRQAYGKWITRKIGGVQGKPVGRNLRAGDVMSRRTPREIDVDLSRQTINVLEG